MGLDMYVSANRYLSEWASNQTSARAAVKEALYFDNGDQAIVVSATVLYWRKADAIHEWFVENIQEGEDNCLEYYVSREQLCELAALCQTDLPLYISTAAAIDELLKDPQYEGWNFSYQASW
jgi:hypothetical protein